ncbi:MAG: hypothetical protein A2Z08_00125 [Deltaproteobacteria bacterium RBG_16_54_11]|nr:MAG: hypothetical protein A2Z08_00125 [Deltaproteobacteria bacterium RBG_16_54_11]
MKRVLLSITVIFLVLCLCGVGWGQKSFVVLGKSEQGEGAPNPTLEMAIKDGLTRAIEAVVVDMIAPQDMKNRQETLSEEFYRKTDAFILSYIILEETPLEAGYQVSLEVVVDTKGIESRLISLGLLKDRDEGPRLREVQVVVSGIKSYETYRAVEQLLSADAEVQGFSPTEITPPLFTWKVMMKGEIGRLADRFLSYDFGGLKVKVTASNSERLEVALSR